MTVLILFLLASSLVADDSVLVILQKAGSSVAFYSPAGEHLANVPVGRHPHEMVLSNDGRYLYTTDNGTMRIEEAGTGGNTVSIVDVIGRRKVGEIWLGKFRRPHGIDMDRSTGRLAVTTELPDQLLVIDPSARKVLRTYETKGKTSHMVTLGPGARHAYVSNSNSRNVSVINLATGEVTLLTTGDRPEGSALSKDGRELYVGNRDGNTISVIDTAKQAVVGEIPIGKGSVRMACTPDGARLVFALYHENKIQVADTKARKVIAEVPLPEHVVSLNLSRDGRIAYASAEDKDTVFVVSLADRKITRQIKTTPGAGPDPVIEIVTR